MSYRDITSQSASVLWGTRAAERNAETRKRLEKEHNVRVGDKVKIVKVRENGEHKKRKNIRNATVVDVYECFILLRIKTKVTGNSFCESFAWQEFEAMRR